MEQHCHPLHFLLVGFSLSILLLGSHTSALEYTIAEEQGPGAFVGNVALDEDLVGRYGQDVVDTLEFSFLTAQEVLTIEKQGGVIRTAGRADRETACPQPLTAATCRLTVDVAVTPAQYFQIIPVVVVITDINDNAPSFPVSAGSAPEVRRGISELAPIGAKIKLPLASDPDWGENAVQEYKYTSPASEGVFRLEVSQLRNGLVSVNLVLTSALDREAVDSYQGTLTAYDGGSPPKVGTIPVTIIVEDGNDHSPRFDNNTYTVNIPENTPINSSVLKVRAQDKDIGDFGKITYTISSPPDSPEALIFGVNPTNGLLYLKRSPDYEVKSSYNVLVEAVDGGPNSQPAQTTVVVNIGDLNDNPPQIKVNALTSSGVAQISESSPSGTFVAHVSVTDSDSGNNGEFGCSLDSALFVLERLPQRTQYKIVTAGRFDRESQSVHFVKLTCTDLGTPAQESVATVTVNVLDENDNKPVFVQSIYSVTLTENNHVNAFIVHVNATDADAGVNAQMTYDLQDISSPMELLRINHQTGAVHANVVFDYESMREFNFQVVATDGGTPAKSATATVYVTIVDINDNAPFFSEPSYHVEVHENQPIGMEIGLVAASDADSEPYNEFEFSFEAGRAAKLFAIDTRTGHIRTKASLDREYQDTYVLTAVATNIHVDRTLSSSVQVTITIKDQNDNAPHVDFPNQQNHTIHISNLVPVSYEVGMISAHDVDEDENARLAYSFTHNADNSAFYIDPITGLISTRSSLQNYDTKLFEMQVLVSDHGVPPKTATATLYVVVDKSVEYAGAAKGGSLLGGSNLTIVIGLAVSSAVVVIILVVAIIFTRMNPRKNNTNRRRSFKNAFSGLGGLKSTTVKTPQNQQQSKNFNAENDKNHAKETSGKTQPFNPKKEVSFNIQNETINGCARGNSTPTDSCNTTKVNNLGKVAEATSTYPTTAVNPVADHSKVRPINFHVFPTIY